MHPMPSWNFNVTTAIEINRTIALKEYICWKPHWFWSWGNQLAYGKSASEMSKTSHQVSANSVKFREELCLSSQNTARSRLFSLLDEESTKGREKYPTHSSVWLYLAKMAGVLLPSCCKVGSSKRGYWNLIYAHVMHLLWFGLWFGFAFCFCLQFVSFVFVVSFVWGWFFLEGRRCLFGCLGMFFKQADTEGRGYL